MSKSLEALKRLHYDMCYHENGVDEERHQEDYELVEKSLKALEIIKDHIMYLKNVDTFIFVGLTTEIKEKLKEILQ